MPFYSISLPFSLSLRLPPLLPFKALFAVVQYGDQQTISTEILRRALAFSFEVCIN